MIITGLMVYYFYVCERKLCFFYNNLSMEHNSELVSVGKAIDTNSYKKTDKHINIDNVINIDYIDSEKCIHEIKKSKAIEKATIMQVKYYLYYLKQKGVSEINAKIDYPVLKETHSLELAKEDEIELERALTDIKIIVSCDVPPELIKKDICKSCAYYDLCYI